MTSGIVEVPPDDVAEVPRPSPKSTSSRSLRQGGCAGGRQRLARYESGEVVVCCETVELVVENCDRVREIAAG